MTKVKLHTKKVVCNSYSKLILYLLYVPFPVEKKKISYVFLNEKTTTDFHQVVATSINFKS